MRFSYANVFCALAVMCCLTACRTQYGSRPILKQETKTQSPLYIDQKVIRENGKGGIIRLYETRTAIVRTVQVATLVGREVVSSSFKAPDYNHRIFKHYFPLTMPENKPKKYKAFPAVSWWNDHAFETFWTDPDREATIYNPTEIFTQKTISFSKRGWCILADTGIVIADGLMYAGCGIWDGLSWICRGIGDLGVLIVNGTWYVVQKPIRYIYDRSVKWCSPWKYEKIQPNFVYTVASLPIFNLLAPGYIPPYLATAQQESEKNILKKAVPFAEKELKRDVKEEKKAIAAGTDLIVKVEGKKVVVKVGADGSFKLPIDLKPARTVKVSVSSTVPYKGTFFSGKIDEVFLYNTAK